jgi:hypothetical protein
MRLPNSSAVRCFSTFDDFKNKNKEGRSKFFMKKNKGREEPLDDALDSEEKETHHKTVKFLKKHELKLKDL